MASAFGLPLFDESAHAVLNLLGPMVPTELERVMAPGAPAVVVRPAADHLPEVRRVLGLPPSRRASSALNRSSAFELRNMERVRFSIELPNPEDRSDLVAMNPNAERLSLEQVTQLGRRLPRTIGMDFWIEIHRRW